MGNLKGGPWRRGLSLLVAFLHGSSPSQGGEGPLKCSDHTFLGWKTVPWQDHEAFGASHTNQEFFPLPHARCLNPGQGLLSGGATAHSLLVCPSCCLRMAQIDSCWQLAQEEAETGARGSHGLEMK